MKKPQFILTVLLALTFTSMQAQVNHIRVVNARNFKAPAMNWNNPDDVATYFVDLQRHKHQEVNVYRYNELYRVSYFQQEGDSIKVHGFGIPDEGVSYDRASYTWNNDTLKLHLFSSTSDAKTKVYRGFGRGRTNSLITD